MSEATDLRPTWTRDFGSFIAHGRSLDPERAAELEQRRAIEDAEERERKLLADKIANARKLSDLGERFETRTFRTYLVPPGDGFAKSTAYKVARDPSSGAWLYGPYRTGKTHLAAAIVNACVQRGIPAAFTTAIGLLDRLKRSYDRDNRLRGGEYDVIEWLSRVDVLVLDDLDKAKFNEWASQRLYALVNRRFEHHKPLIVTTNGSPADLAEQWSKSGLDDLIAGAIMVRMREMCKPIIPLSAPPYEGTE